MRRISQLGIIVLVIYLGATVHVARATLPTTVTLPDMIPVHLYAFEPGTSVADPSLPCSKSNPDTRDRRGCTAIPGVYTYFYPYDSFMPTLDLATDYLPDVVAQETNPAEIAPAAVGAQAVAARGWAYTKVIEHATIINDETNQVFMPYKMVIAGGVSNQPLDPDDPCSRRYVYALTSYQRIVCTGLYQPWYLAQPQSDYPTFTQFEQDFIDGEPAVTGVPFFDPISTTGTAGCNAHPGSNGTGMTQLGASRWARGNRCATGNPLDLWSIQWDRPEQILAHYYIDSDLRFTPGDHGEATQALRWNPLQILWTPGAADHAQPEVLNAGTSYTLDVWSRNTGSLPWTCSNGSDYTLAYRWAEPFETVFESGTSLCDLQPGDHSFARVTIDDVPAEYCGPGTLVFDVQHTLAGGVQLALAATGNWKDYRRTVNIANPQCSRVDPTPDYYIRPLELAFVVDTTNSMDWDGHLWNVLDGITSTLDLLDQQQNSYRVALVSFQDFPQPPGSSDGVNDYPSKVMFDFSSDRAAITHGFLSLANEIGYGGAEPAETMYSGIVSAATQLSWSPSAQKLIIVISDAPPKDPEPNTGYTAAQIIQLLQAQARGTSGAGISVQGVMLTNQTAQIKTIAQATNGVVFENYDSAFAQLGIIQVLGHTFENGIIIRTGGPYVTDASNRVYLDASGSQALGASIAAYDWDLDGDGYYDHVTSVPHFTASYPTGYRGFIGLQITDSAGNVRSARTGVNTFNGYLPLLKR